MLVLCRRPGEKVIIGNRITITVRVIVGSKVREIGGRNRPAGV
jgi:sRNA-binding carbon storage regulator CsrA